MTIPRFRRCGERSVVGAATPGGEATARRVA